MKALSPLAAVGVVVAGALVGFVLGLVGSGGSAFAFPLLVYLADLRDRPHLAIGTAALGVGLVAAASVVHHRRRGAVRLRTGLAFALPGVLGALAGAALGLRTPGAWLLPVFAVLLLVVAARTWRHEAPRSSGAPSRATLVPAGAAVGGVAGYFGIGGGFLAVPALRRFGGLDVRAAVGTSLVAVAAFAFTTAARYAAAGALDLLVAGVFVAGGLSGALAGASVSHGLSEVRLRRAFALLLAACAAYVLWRERATFLTVLP